MSHYDVIYRGSRLINVSGNLTGYIQAYALEYRNKVEKELQDICNVVLGLLDKHLIPKVSDD